MLWKTQFSLPPLTCCEPCLLLVPGVLFQHHLPLPASYHVSASLFYICFPQGTPAAGGQEGRRAGSWWFPAVRPAHTQRAVLAPEALGQGTNTALLCAASTCCPGLMCTGVRGQKVIRKGNQEQTVNPATCNIHEQERGSIQPSRRKHL